MSYFRHYFSNIIIVIISVIITLIREESGILVKTTMAITLSYLEYFGKNIPPSISYNSFKYLSKKFIKKMIYIIDCAHKLKCYNML